MPRCNGVGVWSRSTARPTSCAKNDLFVAFVKDVAKVVAKQNPPMWTP